MSEFFLIPPPEGETVRSWEHAARFSSDELDSGAIFGDAVAQGFVTKGGLWTLVQVYGDLSFTHFLVKENKTVTYQVIG